MSCCSPGDAPSTAAARGATAPGQMLSRTLAKALRQLQANRNASGTAGGNTKAETVNREQILVGKQGKKLGMCWLRHSGKSRLDPMLDSTGK